MRTKNLIVMVAAAALLLLAAGALGAAPPAQSGSPGPDASRAAKVKAYGKYCRGESKRRAGAGRASAYARCLNAMAKLGSGEVRTPAGACKGLSKKHVSGRRGTAYSRCVRAARKLRSNRRGSDDGYRDPFDQP
jgi:hypothetical protein